MCSATRFVDGNARVHDVDPVVGIHVGVCVVVKFVPFQKYPVATSSIEITVAPSGSTPPSVAAAVPLIEPDQFAP